MSEHGESLGRMSEATERFCENPGIREIMEVFGNWQRLDLAAQPYRDAIGVRTIVTFSNSTNPVGARGR